LIGLTVWGCSLDKSGGYESLGSGQGGAGGNGGEGGAATPCGNGSLDVNEECDDGNNDAGDGCGDDCKVECAFPEDLEGEAFEDDTTHHCYLYVHDTITPQDAEQPWYDALYLCRAHGFELAAVNDPQEYDFIHDLGDPEVWVGGNDLAEEGTFAWTTGEPASFDGLWKPGEPSNTAGHENCVEVRSDGLNDQQCGELNRYVCERHPPGPCGNGVIDGAEECDDGNTDDNDGCTGCTMDCETLPYDGLKFKDPSSHHCYLYEVNSTTWELAGAACEGTPGFYFATMSSLGELAFISGKPDVSNAWIGATDQASEDTWLWSSGESWEFIPWMGDPMNGSSEDCLRFLFDDLTAADCIEEHPYLCERDPVGKRSPDAP
jgi:cysteine-rich repeat protein